MVEYQVLNNRKVKLEYRITAFTLGVVLAFAGIFTKAYYDVLIGLPVMYSSLFKKVIVVKRRYPNRI